MNKKRSPKKRSPMEVTISELVDAAGLANEFEACREAGAGFHLRIDNEPFMRLVIEVVNPKEVSVAHYATWNGDPIRDPEIVFNKNWQPIEITQDPVNMYRRAKDGYYLSGVTELANLWARNIRAQGFKDGTFSSISHPDRCRPKATS